ncbi:hypothetical protein QA596_05340 [Balneolales bacterium ANBcel1]|nr:hypothetical protein [Balneolales bacterium ANBcel1]
MENGANYKEKGEAEQSLQRGYRLQQRSSGDNSGRIQQRQAQKRVGTRVDGWTINAGHYMGSSLILPAAVLVSLS